MDSSDEASTAISSTYEWLCANPLASSCGSTICSFYNGSKNLNSVTSMTAGYLEGAVTYMTEKAKPVTAMLSEKFEKPSKCVCCTTCLYTCCIGDDLYSLYSILCGFYNFRRANEVGREISNHW